MRPGVGHRTTTVVSNVWVLVVATADWADLLQEQRGEAANLCFTLAQAHLDLVPADEEKAKIYFNEAIKVRAWVLLQ